MTSGKLPGETDAEQQNAADTFEHLKGKLAELLADMDKLSSPSNGGSTSR